MMIQRSYSGPSEQAKSGELGSTRSGFYLSERLVPSPLRHYRGYHTADVKTFVVPKLHMNSTLRYPQQHTIIVFGQKSRVSVFTRFAYLKGVGIVVG